MEQKRKNRRIRWDIILCLIVYVCILLTLLQTECCAEYYDFRHTHWGMTQKEVMFSESLPLKEGGDTYLKYEDKTGVLITYKFINNRLTCIHNDVHKVHYNPHHDCSWSEKFMQHCDTYRRALNARYGPGAQHFIPLSQINPNNILHPWKDKQDTYSIGWKTPHTNVNLHITNIDYHYLRFTIVFEESEKRRTNYEFYSTQYTRAKDRRRNR